MEKEKKEKPSLSAPLYHLEEKKVSSVNLEPEIFGLKINPDLVYQVAMGQLANRRKPIAHTKDRSEVRGGGRKPWRQKGTGRARHGSIRSPLWKGGGVTFGPRKEKEYKKEIPKKMRKKALLMVLSAKAQKNFLIVLDSLRIEKPKTKSIKEIIDQLKEKIESFTGKSILIALPNPDKKIILSARNIPHLATLQAKDLNCLDLLSFKYLVLPEESIEVIKKTFLKK